MGLRDALFEDAITIHKTLNGDLVVIDSDGESFWQLNTKSLPRSVLYSVAAVEGIESINPLYINFGNFKNPQSFDPDANPENRAEAEAEIAIGVLAFKPDKPVFKMAEVTEQIAKIQQTDTFLFDRLSRPEYGPIVQLFEESGPVTTEISGRNVTLDGLFELGGGVFSANGVVITSDANFARTLGQPLEKVQMGLVQVDPNANLEMIQQEIAQLLPPGVVVRTMEEVMQIEQKFWDEETPSGFIFNCIAWIGFIVGALTVYQVLFTQVTEYLAIYATLKAVGYPNSYMVKTMLEEGLLISILSYIPALIISTFLYDFIAYRSRLPLAFSWSRCLIVFALTNIMCVVASAIVARKLREADPADLFS